MRQTNRLTMNYRYPEKPATVVQFHQVNPHTNSNTMHVQRNALLDHISDAVIFTDMDLRILYINKRAEQVYGVRSKDVTGYLFRDVIQYEYINDSPEEALQILQQTGSWQGKVLFTRKDKQQFYLLSTVTFARDE